MINTSQLVEWLKSFNELVQENKNYLTELDSAIGDADHGANMARGMKAVVDKLPADSSPAALFKGVGMTLVSTVGGASGPLYGSFFMKLGSALGADEQINDADFASALRAGFDSVKARGKAALGEKTMIDAMSPALDAFDKALADGADIASAAKQCWQEAKSGCEATIPMVAHKGRASYLGERSAGHQDPGATSTSYLFEALAKTLS